METFQEVAESQVKKEENEGTADAAKLIDKLSVEDKKVEKKAEAPASAKEEKESDEEPKKADSNKVEEPSSAT